MAESNPRTVIQEPPPNPATLYLRSRLNGMGLNELMDWIHYFRLVDSAEHTSPDPKLVKIWERLKFEVNLAMNEKISHFMGLAEKAEVEGPFDGAS